MGAFTSLVHNGTGAPGAAARPALRLQRACASCAGKDDECESCQKAPLQRRASTAGAALPAPSAGAGTDFTSGGQRMPGVLRSQLEPLFGVRFDAVRLHDDARSHALAQRYGARAFTLGQDVHFARGEFRPGERGGMALLAHELSHTVQQRGAMQPTAAAKSVAVDAPDSPLEAEADAAAARVLAGQPAAVRAGSAAGGISRVQRVPAAETVTRPVDDHTRVAITRTVTDPGCTELARTTSTPASDIFYSDGDAHTLGMRYSICHGSVRVRAGASVNYDSLVRSAENLLDTLRSDPTRATDISRLLSDAVNNSHVSANGNVELTVSGSFNLRVSGGATVGPAEQRYNVQGELRATPRGVSFRVTGGLDVAVTQRGEAATYTLEGNATTNFASITLSYRQIDTTAVGAPPSTERSLRGELSARITDSLSAGFFVTGDPSSGGGLTGGGLVFSGTWGGPERVDNVDCHACDCPPPQIRYACTRTVDPTSRPVVDVAAGRDHQRLLYAYNSDAPADAAAFSAQVGAMAAQVRSGYRIEHITGHASPEASRAYNVDLSVTRASHARQALQAALSEAPGSPAGTAAGLAATSAVNLPPAVGAGELLGDSSAPTGEEASNAALIAELTARLSPLTEEQRLDLLGVDGPARSEPDARQRALDDVQAFIEGRDAGGRRLGQRARWERIFPFLRRVDVELVRDEQSHLETTAGSTSTTCEPADLAWAASAESTFTPLSARDRLPSQRCDR